MGGVRSNQTTFVYRVLRGGGTLRPDRLMACNVLYRPLGFMSTLVSMGYKLCFHTSVEIHEEGTLTVTYELLYIVNLR